MQLEERDPTCLAKLDGHSSPSCKGRYVKDSSFAFLRAAPLTNNFPPWLTLSRELPGGWGFRPPTF